MSEDMYRRKAERHQAEMARLQKSKADAAGKASDERKKAQSATDSAHRSSSVSTQRSKLAEAQRHQGRAVGYDKDVAGFEAKIAREHTALNDALKSLRSAEVATRRKDDQEATRRRQAEERHAREQASKISTMTNTLARHGAMHRTTQSAIERLERLPERITVLMLSSNPLDQPQLRLDEEARAIQDTIRKSAFRDAVQFETRWAVQAIDVLQALNELAPTVVHFSGHGSSDDEIVFQDNAGNAKCVSLEAIVATLTSASDDIQLVFFNTCFSEGQARAVVAKVPAAIGMSTTIGDTAARVFAAQFYSAIGFGLSVGRAFQQARAAVLLEGIDEADIPRLHIQDGVSADEMVLVRREP